MKRFYWENPFVFETEVELTQIDGSVCTIMPEIFHPDEGGQPQDLGTIADAQVFKIEAKDGRSIISLDKPLVSGRYLARIDSGNRVSQSRRHTAQHIISGIAEKQMGLLTAGVRIGETCTIDFDKKIEWDQAEKLENLSNQAIMLDLPVSTEYGTLTDRGRFNQELSGKDSDDLRVVAIGEIDRSACCGTHVPTTAMIGSVRIISIEASRQGSRIAFMAGMDSIKFGFAESAVLRELRKATSCANNELSASFSKLQEQVSQLGKDNISLWEKLIPFELDNAMDINSGSFTVIKVLYTSAPIKMLPKIAQMLSGKTGQNSIVFSQSGSNATISSPSAQAKDIFARLAVNQNVKGGGSPQSVNAMLEKGLGFEDIKILMA